MPAKAIASCDSEDVWRQRREPPARIISLLDVTILTSQNGAKIAIIPSSANGVGSLDLIDGKLVRTHMTKFINAVTKKDDAELFLFSRRLFYGGTLAASAAALKWQLLALADFVGPTVSAILVSFVASWTIVFAVGHPEYVMRPKIPTIDASLDGDFKAYFDVLSGGEGVVLDPMVMILPEHVLKHFADYLAGEGWTRELKNFLHLPQSTDIPVNLLQLDLSTKERTLRRAYRLAASLIEYFHRRSRDADERSERDRYRGWVDSDEDDTP